MRAAEAKRDAYKPQDNDSMCLRWESDQAVKFWLASCAAWYWCDRSPSFGLQDCAFMLPHCCALITCNTVYGVRDGAWRAVVGTGLCCEACTDGCGCREPIVNDRQKETKLCHYGFFCCGPQSEAVLENYAKKGYRELAKDEHWDKFQSGPLAHQEMRN